MLRKRQYEYTQNDIGRKIEQNKIANQMDTLKNIRKKTEEIKEGIEFLQDMIDKLNEPLNYLEVMGIEGNAARVYFTRVFNNVKWNGRKPRIKNDYINVTLDIGYTMLFNIVDAILQIYGFDTYYGVFHKCFYMRKSLVCDIMEPMRPIIDYEIRKAINLNQCKKDDFEVYDPKVDNQVRLTREGLTGNKVIEYLAIPRHAGTYKIPGVSFSYFDIRSKSYKTLKTEEYVINVEKGAGNADQVIANFTNKEDLKVLGEDIRYIKQNEVTLQPKGSFFYGSMTYWLFYIIPALAFIIFFIIYRKQAAENANVAKMRTKKANKVATKRMKLAGKLLSENKKDAFYDEVLKALWGYISDKLNIPVSRLSKDNIEEKLRNHGVNEELIKEFLNALNDCEFARFAPGDENQAMDKVYSSSIEVISKMENSIKH